MSILDDMFSRYLPLIEQDLRSVLTPAEHMPDTFYKMLHYHMGWVDETGGDTGGRGGKRIRPVLTLLCCEAVSNDPTPARPAAAAVELIHNFSLLHDDVQDKSPTRRGRPTAWSIWGAPQAINAGDTLFTLAYLAVPRLSEENTDPTLSVEMWSILGDVCLELTRGQFLDMSFEDRDDVTTNEYLDMIRGKTAALLAGAARLGALAGGDDTEKVGHYAAFGESLGMAFQVLDDSLDIWGDPDLTGKEAAVDIRQRKKSLPVLYGLARGEAFRILYNQPQDFTDSDVKHAVELLDETGAREYAHDLASRYSEDTLSHLEAANPTGDAAEVLYGLVSQLLHRDR